MIQTLNPETKDLIDQMDKFMEASVKKDFKYNATDDLNLNKMIAILQNHINMLYKYELDNKGDR